MKLLSILCSSLLCIGIILSGTAFILDKTTQAAYLTKTAEKSDIYRGVAEIASKRLVETSAASLGVPEQTLQQAVSSIVTEEYIKNKSGDITTQVEQVLRGESSLISIEFSDLITQANAAGLALNQTDVKPIEIQLPQNINETTVKSAQNLDLFRFISYILTALFFVISLTIAILRRSSIGLGIAAITSAGVFVIIALSIKLLEAVAANIVVIPEEVRELDRYANTFINVVVSDICRQYLAFAAGLIIFGVLCLIVHKLLRPLRDRLPRSAIVTTARPLSSPEK